MFKYLSCDWGTSSFRLRLIDAANLKVIAEEKSDEGIASTYALWKSTGNNDQESRFVFYFNIIYDHIKKIERRLDLSLKEVPLIISGMASSSIGMKELPYKKLPFSTDGADMGVAYFENNNGMNHPVLLISGVSSEDDVMRGEETQLVGFIDGQPPENTAEDQVYIFPGTHSKHIVVSNGQIKDFSTYMTGELFELLSKKSILNVSVAESQSTQTPALIPSFKQGVQDGSQTNLLHASFHVRTNHLFSKLTREENFSYLSGLLIGAELKELLHMSSHKIFLCSSNHLKLAYQTALQALGLQQSVHVFSDQRIDEAVVRGHLKIFQQFKLKRSNERIIFLGII